MLNRSWSECALRGSRELRTLLAHLILFDFSLVLLDFIVVHVSEGILSVVRLVDDGIVLLITFDNTLGGRANHDHRFRQRLMRFLNGRRDGP